jgi:hypothetical protein
VDVQHQSPNVTAPNVTTTSKKGRRGCLLWLIVLVPIIILFWKFVVIPVFETGMGQVVTVPVPGDATTFDPISTLPQVMAYAGDGAQVTEISAYYVRSDGTLDLTASYHPYVEYEFVRKVPAPADAPPVGAGGTVKGGWFEPVTVKAYEPGKWWSVHSGNSTYSYMNRGMERKASRPTSSPSPVLPVPKCSFKTLWSAAAERGASTDAVATIIYRSTGYRFSVRDTDIDLNFNNDCHLTD